MSELRELVIQALADAFKRDPSCSYVSDLDERGAIVLDGEFELGPIADAAIATITGYAPQEAALAEKAETYRWDT
jgi:hypothetical protein